MLKAKEEDRDTEDAAPIQHFRNLSKFAISLLSSLTSWYPNLRLTNIIANMLHIQLEMNNYTVTVHIHTKAKVKVNVSLSK